MYAGVQYILIIPGYNRYGETKEIKKCREGFYNRVLASVVKSNLEDFVGLYKLKKIAKARELLEKNNGIQRNGRLAVELPFTLVLFPNQFHYANNNIPLADVQRNVKQDGSVEIDFFDHSPAHRVLLKWKDLHAVQIWAEHHRGDLRPQVELKKRWETSFNIATSCLPSLMLSGMIPFRLWNLPLNMRDASRGFFVLNYARLIANQPQGRI